MYTIFIHERPFIISANQSKYPLKKGLFYSNDDSRQNIIVLCNMLRKDEIPGVFLFTQNEEKCFGIFRSLYKIIEAAGGIIENEKDEILMIHRRGKWDMPKGKIDAGENEKQAAVREVKEECGLKNVILGEKICTSYHVYKTSKGEVLKFSHWYGMHAGGDEKLIPQKEEDIIEIKWFDKNVIRSGDLDAYHSIMEVLKTYLEK